MKLANSILRMTPGAADRRGLIHFRLAWWLRGTEKAHLPVVSGQPGAQVLRTAAEATPGRYEPIPEGVYRLGDADAPTGVNRTAGDFGPGLGSIWVGVHPEAGFGPERFIGIHEDANSSTSPGTAACLGAMSKKDMETIASWFVGPDRPKQLVVDYARGTVPGAPRGPVVKLL